MTAKHSENSKSSSPDAERLLQRFEDLKAARSGHETQWRELARYCHPSRTIGMVDHANKNLGRETKAQLFDSTAALSADSLASGLFALMTNPAMDWFELDGEQAEMNEALTAAFEDRRHGLYGVLPDLFRDLVTFGTAVMSVEAGEGGEVGELRFAVRRLDEMLFAANSAGKVDTAFRSFVLSAEQIAQRYGDAMQKAVFKALDNGQPDQRFELVHAVFPRLEFEAEAVGPRGMAYQSVVLDPIERQVLHNGGYHEFPYLVTRWSMGAGSGEVFGESPASLALADIKALNAMVRTNLTAAQKAVDPPLMAVDDNGLRGMKTHPGAIVYGGLDLNGKRMVEPLPMGSVGAVNLGLALEEQRRASIREAFHLSLLQDVNNQAVQTATEFLGRQEERLRLLAPNLGRIEAELLYPLVVRSAAILARAGKAPKPPSKWNIRFLSPLAQAQRAAEAHRLTRSIKALQPFAEVVPSVMEKLDAEALSQDLLDFAGLPQRNADKEGATV